MPYCCVMTTCGSKEEAQRIAAQIVHKKAGACVQLREVTSVYTWQGEVHYDPEHLLYIKTTQKAYPQLEKLIRDTHSYDVPEIVSLPIQNGLKEYLDWIDEVTE